jgi:hypothetical protein
MREQILDQQAEDGKQHDVMVAGHQERERRRERLNSEAAERAHEAATRPRKVESGAEWSLVPGHPAWKGPDVASPIRHPDLDWTAQVWVG